MALRRSSGKYSGSVKVVLPMVRSREKGVLSTMAASSGRLTYWLALLMVMGRMAVEAPPRIPITANGA